MAFIADLHMVFKVNKPTFFSGKEVLRGSQKNHFNFAKSRTLLLPQTNNLFKNFTKRNIYILPNGNRSILPVQEDGRLSVDLYTTFRYHHEDPESPTIEREKIELEELAKQVLTSIPWTDLPISTTHKKQKQWPKDDRFLLRDVWDHPPSPLYWHPPIVPGTLDARIAFLIRDKKFKEAKAVMRKANMSGKPYEEWQYGMMMYQYTKLGKPMEVKGLFYDAVKNNRYTPTTQSYHNLLNAYCLNRDIEGAQYLLERMRANNIPITHETYSYFVSFRNPLYQYMEELIRLMQKNDNLEPSGLIWSHMIDAYRRDYNHEKAIITFHSLPMEVRDLNCIHSIMNVYFDLLEVAKAEYYFRKTLTPTTKYPALLQTWYNYFYFYEKHGDYKAADALVDRMRSEGYPITTEVYNSVIRARFNGENYHYGVKGFEELLADKNVKPDHGSCAAYMDCLGATDQLDRARLFYKDAQKNWNFKYDYRTNPITCYAPKIKFSRKPPKVG